MQKLNFKLR